jgi:hypothetical protein
LNSHKSFIEIKKLVNYTTCTPVSAWGNRLGK